MSMGRKYLMSDIQYLEQKGRTQGLNKKKVENSQESSPGGLGR